MIFVIVGHEIFVGEKLAIRKERDIACRGVGTPPAKAGASVSKRPPISVGPLRWGRGSFLAFPRSPTTAAASTTNATTRQGRGLFRPYRA